MSPLGNQNNSNTHLQMSGKGIPIFTGKHFAHWKLKAEWHIDWMYILR